MPETENTGARSETERVGMTDAAGRPSPTFGQRTVRASFNPSGNARVDTIKVATAAMIDLCNGMRGSRGSELNAEQNRLASLAITAYEEAAMWAVKAATTGDQ